MRVRKIDANNKESLTINRSLFARVSDVLGRGIGRGDVVVLQFPSIVKKSEAAAVCCARASTTSLGRELERQNSRQICPWFPEAIVACESR
jgi:hypothetical protein